jgi:perosamine synthetase
MYPKENDPQIIPMSSPDITDAERDAVAAVMRTNYLSMGQEITAFEDRFRRYTDIQHAIGVSSGTAGLHLCVRAAGIGRGDIVITTPFSFVASSNVLLYEGAIPVFVDIDERTGNIDTALVKTATEDLFQGGLQARRWLPRTGAEHTSTLKAILPVDVFGQPADMDPMIEISENYRLKIIEDSCEALGAEYKGRKAGTLGNFGVFAFYPNKQITTGEGGMIVTDDDWAADFMRALRNQGRAPGDTWLQHTYLGYNYRLNELSAVIGRLQMDRLDELITKRQKVAEWYNERLIEIPGTEIPQLSSNTNQVSWFVYVIRLDESMDREHVADALSQVGVPARPYFTPIHLQPYMVERFGFRAGEFPVTEDLGRRSLALPFSSVMSEAQVDYVCQQLMRIVAKNL